MPGSRNPIPDQVRSHDNLSEAPPDYDTLFEADDNDSDLGDMSERRRRLSPFGAPGEPFMTAPLEWAYPTNENLFSGVERVAYRHGYRDGWYEGFGTGQTVGRFPVHENVFSDSEQEAYQYGHQDGSLKGYRTGLIIRRNYRRNARFARIRRLLDGSYRRYRLNRRTNRPCDGYPVDPEDETSMSEGNDELDGDTLVPDGDEHEGADEPSQRLETL